MNFAKTLQVTEEGLNLSLQGQKRIKQKSFSLLKTLLGAMCFLEITGANSVQSLCLHLCCHGRFDSISPSYSANQAKLRSLYIAFSITTQGRCCYMGMGDRFKQKAPYSPTNGSTRCDVTGKTFSSSLIRKCNDEAVIRRYGTGGVCNVSVWVCTRCKHAIRYKFHGGLGCELDRQLQA